MKTFGLKFLKLACCGLAFGLATECVMGLNLVTTEVQARVGRPASPVSVRGVARRTTRRTVRRTTVYVATLPKGYKTVVVEGTTLYVSGTTYYQKVDKKYVVVTVS